MAAVGALGAALLLAGILGQATPAASPTPPVTAGLQLWYEADTTSYADGQPVTTWADKSGFGRNLTSSGTSDAPTMRRNAVNGRAAIEFNGAQSLMKTYGSTFTLTQPTTFFIVYRSLDPNNSVRAFVFDSTNSITREAFGRAAASDVRLYADIDLDLGGITYPFSSFQVFSGIFNGTASSAYRDQTSIGSGNSGGSSLSGFTVGGLSTSGVYGYDYSHSLVAEILYYKGALSATDRASVTDWLDQKYTVTAPPTAPSNTALPTVSGTARDGSTLTATTGTWSGTAPISFAYQWQRCNSAGAACANISGAAGATYAVVPADVGSTIGVTVTASNSVGSASAGSAVSAVVAAAAPVNTAAPSVSGTARDGSTLTATTGSWNGTAPLSFAYQWQRCNAAGASCANISGALASTYAVAAADLGSTLAVTVTASNSGGSASAGSAVSAVVAAAAPVNTALPSISGSPQVGAVLTAGAGTWTGTAPLSFAYQWQRCNAAGTSCANISGAVASTYTVAVADVGSTLAVRVTASNSAGSASASSAVSAVVAAAPPVNTAPPTVSGTARDGSTLTATTGTWNGTSLSFAYQWQRCNAAGASCANISGAVASTYTVAAADVGSTLAIMVTASNSAGSASAGSAVTAIVAALAPVNTALPSISGTAQVGVVLTAGVGTWTGTAPLSFAYQWQRCNAAGASCANISGATAATYSVAAADVGSTLAVTVTASNSAGSASAGSAVSAVVAAAPPVNTTPPTVSGTARDGSTLTATTGTWSGTSLSFAYQWQRCNAAGASCANISGAVASTYTVAAADVGSTLAVTVTASNSTGSASAGSAVTAIVAAAPPVNTAAPTVSGTAREGSTLTATTGTWAGTAPLSFAYQWQRCNAAGASCADISGAVASTYAVVAADVGSTLAVTVTASNSAGSAPAGSAVSAIVAAAAPLNTALPSISGTPQVSAVLTAGVGTWTGTAPLSFAYQWQRCNAVGAACANISGAVASTYTVAAADVGSTLAVTVTASNSAGSASAGSAASAVVAAAAPVNTAPPTVSGTARDGSTLTATTGTWSGTSLSFAYQWQRCNAAGASCANISGALAATYAVVAADVGSTLAVTVTASNSAGSASAGSAASAVVAAAAPVNTALPSISGTAQVGSALTAAVGTWTGTAPLSFAYQWQRCDVTGAACAAVAGATGSTYTLVTADAGSTVRVLVTASNSAGNAAAQSAQTATIATSGGIPSNPPVTAGLQLWYEAGTEAYSEGQPVTTWTDKSGNGRNLTALDPSQAPVFHKSAVNGRAAIEFDGVQSLLKTYNSTFTLPQPTTFFIVYRSLDANTSARAYVFDSRDSTNRQIFGRGGASDARMYGNIDLVAPTVTYPFPSFQVWSGAFNGAASSLSRSGTVVATGNTGGASQTGFTLGGLSTSGQYGYDMTHSQVAEILYYTGNLSSTDRDAVTAWLNQKYALYSGPLVPPAVVAAPTISGTLQDGATLASTTGSWSGTLPLTYAYQWRRCNASGGSCADIAGATSTSYTLTSADVASTITVVVTASNGAGFASTTAATTGVVAAAPPSSTSPPTVSGTAKDGSTLTAANGAWNGTAPLGFAYQWQRCDAAGLNCAPISGGTAQSYLVVTADVASTIRVAVTASNAAGNATATSAQTAVVASASGPPPATPPVTAGLQLWYEANTETYTEGQSVTTWTDKSGFGRNLTAFDPSQAPVFHRSAVNGRAAIEFDGVQSLLKTYNSTFTLPQPTTFFIVYRSLDTALPGSEAYVFDSMNSSVRQLLGLGPLGSTEMYADIDFNPPGTYPFPSYQVWSGTFNGASSSAWRNGVKVATANAGGSGLAGFTVGALSTSGQYGYNYSHSLIAEILYYTGAMTDSDRAAVTGWLNGKYSAY